MFIVYLREKVFLMVRKEEMLWIAVVKRDAPTRSSAWTQMMLDEILFGQIRLEPVIGQ